MAMTGMEHALGPTDWRILMAKENLALTFTEVKVECLDSAHEMMRRVLEESRKTLGKEHPYTLLAMVKLARIENALN